MYSPYSGYFSDTDAYPENLPQEDTWYDQEKQELESRRKREQSRYEYELMLSGYSLKKQASVAISEKQRYEKMLLNQK